MPTRTFLNLPKEKQEKLLASAKREFTRVSLYEASINKIIQEAAIPRGSFYMYFKDKEELYFYILQKYRHDFFVLIRRSLRTANGNLTDAFIAIFDALAEYCFRPDNHAFFRNVFVNMNFQSEKFLFAKGEGTKPIDHWKSIQDLVDIKLFRPIAKEHLEDVFALYTQCLVQAFLPTFLLDRDIKEAREQLIRKLHLLEHGILN